MTKKDIFVRRFNEHTLCKARPVKIKKGFNEAESTLLSYISPHVDLDQTILELGCGDGYWMDTLKKFGYKNIIGLDFLEESINYDGFDIRVVDITKPFDLGKKIDFVLASGIFMHLDRYEAVEAVKNTHAVMKRHTKLCLLDHVVKSTKENETFVYLRNLESWEEIFYGFKLLDVCNENERFTTVDSGNPDLYILIWERT